MVNEQIRRIIEVRYSTCYLLKDHKTHKLHSRLLLTRAAVTAFHASLLPELNPTFAAPFSLPPPPLSLSVPFSLHITYSRAHRTLTLNTPPSIDETTESFPDTSTMGLAYNVYLSSSKIYGCKNCKAHLSNHEDIISRVCLLPFNPLTCLIPFYVSFLFNPPSSRLSFLLFRRSPSLPPSRPSIANSVCVEEFPRSTRQSLPLPNRRKRRRWRPSRAQHDDRQAHSPRYYVQAV